VNDWNGEYLNELDILDVNAECNNNDTKGSHDSTKVVLLPEVKLS